MALQKGIEFRGVILPDAYHRVTQTVLCRARNQVMATVSVFQDEEAAADSRTEVEVRTYFLPYDPTTTVGDVYLQLKALPEYAGAVDV